MPKFTAIALILLQSLLYGFGDPISKEVYIAFSDCTWDAITEGNTNIDELPSKFPGEYFISSFNGRYYIYSDEMCKNLISTYAFDEVLTHRIKSEEL